MVTHIDNLFRWMNSDNNKYGKGGRKLQDAFKIYQASRLFSSCSSDETWYAVTKISAQNTSTCTLVLKIVRQMMTALQVKSPSVLSTEACFSTMRNTSCETNHVLNVPAQHSVWDQTSRRKTIIIYLHQSPMIKPPVSELQYLKWRNEPQAIFTVHTVGT